LKSQNSRNKEPNIFEDGTAKNLEDDVRHGSGGTPCYTQRHHGATKKCAI